MIEYKNYPDNNLVEISVLGKITEVDFDRVSSQMKADIDKHVDILLALKGKDWRLLVPLKGREMNASPTGYMRSGLPLWGRGILV